MTNWDHEVDVVVLGSGGAGLTSALTAAVNGASVEVYEKAATVGGTTAVSGGIVWIPAHNRLSEGELTVEDAMSYLRAQSLGFMDDELVDTFVRTGPEMLDFVEAHSELQFEVAEGFPDYKPELPGGRPAGGRSLNAKPFDRSRLGEWGDRITSFPRRLQQRRHRRRDACAHPRIRGRRVGRLLRGGHRPDRRAAQGAARPGCRTAHQCTRRRAVRRCAGDHRRPDHTGRQTSSTFAPVVVWCWAPAGSNGTRSWSRRICAARCAARCRRRTTPATGCAWPWRTAPIWPTWARRGGYRSSRCRATPSTGIRAAAASGSNGPGPGASSSTARASGSSTRPANTTRWRARSISSTPSGATPTIRRGSSSTRSISSGTDSSASCPNEDAPDWFAPSADLTELGEKTGIDADGLAATLAAWNDNVAHEQDPDFGRGASAYDGYWGDDSAATPAGKTLGPIDTPPYYAVPVSIGAMGTKGGPRTDRDGRVLHVSGIGHSGAVRRGQCDGGRDG